MLNKYSAESPTKSPPQKAEQEEKFMTYHLVAKITGKDKLEQSRAFQKLDFEDQEDKAGDMEGEEDDERGGIRSKIDHFIDLLQSQNEDSGEFIYLNPSNNLNPYDLQPIVDISAKDALKSNAARDGLKNDKALNIEKFYTLSKKGLTLYLNDEPHEFISLTDWLIERNYHHKISSMPFFQQFKRWKILRMWRRNILQKKREKYSNFLNDNLFMLHKTFGPIIMDHKGDV